MANLPVFVIFLLLFRAALPCSIPPHLPYYTVAEQAILAPVVLQAFVLKTNRTNNWGDYKACIKVEKVFKGNQFVRKAEFCMGQFGPEELCLGDIAAGSSYVMFLNKDLTARYDVYHRAAIHVQNEESLKDLKRGLCDTHEDSTTRKCIAPRISDEVPDQIHVNESSSLRLSCEASGTIPFVTTWQVDGHDIVPPARVLSNGEIFIETMTPSLRGRYTCTVHNPVGEVSKNISVEVIQTPCGGFRNSDSKGIVESPNYPDPYPRDKMCVWRICPPKGRRLLINFLDFDLRNIDRVTITNECDPSGMPWRRYCGNAFPQSFVTRCRSTCAQIALSSANFYNSGARGIKFSYESTKDKRTRFGVKELFCQSDFVIHASINDLFNRHIVVDVKEAFKGEIPVEDSPFGTAQIKLFHADPFTDAYGCRMYMHFKDEFYFAGKITDGKATIVHTFTENDKDLMPKNMIGLLKKYKENHPKCQA